MYVKKKTLKYATQIFSILNPYIVKQTCIESLSPINSPNKYTNA